MKMFRFTAISVAVVALTFTGLFGSWSDHTHLIGDQNMIIGNDHLVTQTREVKPFQRIKTDIGVDIYVTIGQPQSVKITLDDNVVDFVETEVYGKTLSITSNSSFSTKHQCRAEIIVPSLDGITSEGSGDIEVTKLRGDEFSFTLEGSGDFRADGKVDHIDIELNGSGNVDTRELIAHSAKVQLDGSGNVKVYADEDVQATIDGSGDISYYGNPKRISKDVSGSGRIRKR